MGKVSKKSGGTVHEVLLNNSTGKVWAILKAEKKMGKVSKKSGGIYLRQLSMLDVDGFDVNVKDG